MDDKLLNNSNDAKNNDFSNCELMKMHFTGQRDYEKNYQTAIDYLFKSLDEAFEQCKNDYYEIITLKKEYGKSFEERIYIIEEKGGIPVEYELMEKILGERDVDFIVEKQSVSYKDGYWIDKIDIEISNGEKVSYYFDITRSF